MSMKFFIYRTLPSICLVLCFACTKDVAKNPILAYSDKAMFDSIKNESAFNYYKNNPAILSGANGPHGTFKLKFNKIAQTALTDNGKLPIGGVFPEGSLVLKEIESPAWYAFMYKKSNAWLWGEIAKTGEVIYSVNKNPNLCISCHNQSGHRDLVVSFEYY